MTELNVFRSALAACIAAPAPGLRAPATPEELALVEAVSALDRGECLADFSEEVTDLLGAAGFGLREEPLYEGSSSYVAWLERGWRPLGVVSTLTLDPSSEGAL